MVDKADSQGTATPQTAPQDFAQSTADMGLSLDAKTLQQEVERHKEQAKRNLDGWKRAAADLENYRKRVEKEQAELVKFSNAALITKLLSVLDDLERAFQTCPAELSRLTWIEGLLLIDRKLRLLLESQGLSEIEALGKPFDPILHEAVLEEQTDKHADGQVMAVLQRGYKLHERVLRPAMVKVARNLQGSISQQSGEPAASPRAEDRQEQ